MKKIVSLFLMLALAASLSVTAAFADASLTVTSETAQRGDTVTVTVSISGNTGFSSGLAAVSYDSSVLELLEMNPGEAASGMLSSANPATGKINFAGASDMKSDGALFKARFRVLDTADVGASAVSATVRLQDIDGAYVMDNVTASGVVTVTDEHVWGGWIVTTEPTCTDIGAETRTCSSCGETQTRDIAALGHKWDEAGAVVTREASAAARGEKTVVCLNDSAHTKTVEFDVKFTPKLFYNSVAEADKAVLLKEIVGAGYSEDNVALYNMTLAVSYDDGATAVNAAEAPSEGVSVTFPYPAGTNAAGCDFAIFQRTAGGTAERLIPAEDSDGLTVTVRSLSPVAVAWKQAAGNDTIQHTATPNAGAQKDKAPKMGETSYISVIAAGIALGTAGIILFSKKKNGKKNG